MRLPQPSFNPYPNADLQYAMTRQDLHQGLEDFRTLVISLHRNCLTLTTEAAVDILDGEFALKVRGLQEMAQRVLAAESNLRRRG